MFSVNLHEFKPIQAMDCINLNMIIHKYELLPCLIGAGLGFNPKLMPFESKNLDLALEWYYGEGSYAAMAMFKKDVDGYLAEEEVIEVVTVPSGTYDYKI